MDFILFIGSGLEKSVFFLWGQESRELIFFRFSRRLLPTTLILLSAIAAPPIMGLSKNRLRIENTCSNGYSDEIVNKSPEQILMDGFYGSPGQADGFRDFG